MIKGLTHALQLKPAAVVSLNISQQNYYNFPLELQQFDSLKHLDASKNRLGEIPEWLSELKALENLSLRQNLINEIGLLKLPLLHTLDLQKNQLDTLYFYSSQLPALEILAINNNGLKYIDQGLCRFTQLKNISVSFNELRVIPRCNGLDKMEVMRAENNQLLQWPSLASSKNSLKELHLQNNAINALPSEIKLLNKLEVLDLSNNDLHALPEEISGLINLKILTLSGNNLKKLPESIKNCDKLSHLYLVNNPISEEEFAKIKSYLPNCQIVR